MKVAVNIVDGGCDIRPYNVAIRARRHLVILSRRELHSQVHQFPNAKHWLMSELSPPDVDHLLVFLHASDNEDDWRKVVTTLDSWRRNGLNGIKLFTYSGGGLPASLFRAGALAPTETSWWKHYSHVQARYDIDSGEQASLVGSDPKNPPVEEVINEIVRTYGDIDPLSAGSANEAKLTPSSGGNEGLRHTLVNAVGPLRQATDFALATGTGLEQLGALRDHLIRRTEPCRSELPPSILDSLRRCEAEIFPKLAGGRADVPLLTALQRELALIEAFAIVQDRPRSTSSGIQAALPAKPPQDPIRILWIDDERAWFEALAPLFGRFGIEAEYCSDPEARLASLENLARYDAILLDLILEGHGQAIGSLLQTHGVQVDEPVNDSTAGIAILRLIQTLPQPPATFVLSARESPQIVRACTMYGARDYFVKGQDDQVRLLLELRHESEVRRKQVSELLVPRNPDLVLASEGDPLANTILRIHRLASSKLTRAILLIGEPGVGKEELAKEFHLRSAHRTGPFKPLDCTTVVASAIESELFGHKRGAFTGAVDHRSGLIEQGKGGVVFIDEVDKLSPDLQNRLLRFIETGKIRRVGEDTDRTVDSSIVFASNADPTDEASKFSEPFVSRLQSFMVRVPPLRARSSALEMLAKALCVRLAAKEDRAPPLILAPALQWLAAEVRTGRFDGAGANVRGIRNLIARTLIEFPDAVEFGRAEFEQVANEQTSPPASATTALRKAARTVLNALVHEDRANLQELCDTFEAALVHSIQAERGAKRAADFFGWTADNLRQYREKYRRKKLWPDAQ